jgi:hypothetical protein
VIDIPNEAVIEPQETGIKGAYVARVISRTYDASELRVLKEIKSPKNRLEKISFQK